MAGIAQPVTTYSDTTPQKRMITDVISLIDPTDTPLIAALGGLDGAASKFRFTNTPGVKVEWLEDTHIPLSDTLNCGATVTSTATELTVTDATLYEPGYIIRIGSELLWISAISSTKITVTRGVAGSTAATCDSIAAVSIVGNARVEGAESTAIGITDSYIGSNVTQIFHQEVKVSRSQAKLAQYGISNYLAYQRDKAVPSQMRLVEQSILQSKGASVGSSSAARIMSGIQGFVSTNKISGASLAQSQFESAVKAIYQYGGTPPFLAVVSPTNLLRIKNFYDDVGAGRTLGTASRASVLRIGQDTKEIGMDVQRIITPFGNVDLLLDRWAEDTLIPILSVDNAGLWTYDPFSWKDLAITGDYERQEVVAELTFCLRQEKSHALLTNVS